MTTEELVQYYADLIIMQYRNKPKAVATVSALVSEAVGDQIIQQVEDAFDVDTAVGDQLDAIGTYVGAQRQIVGLDLGKEYFAFPAYADPSPEDLKGFADYSDADEDIFWYFQLYAEAPGSTILADPDFRTYIKFLARLNSLNLGLADIDQLLFDFMGDFVTLTDNEDMTILYEDAPDDPSTLFKILNYTGQLPHPAGVEVLTT
jgi:Protein of unknown function (DUF2612)